MKKLKRKKIAFIAHEFGLYKGHGGIASYLYNICSWLLKHSSIEIFVLADYYDKNCNLFSNKSFHFHPLKGNIHHQRDKVYDFVLSNEDLSYVEFADFHALGLYVVLEKVNNSKFNNTVLVTNNHTATRECYEWSNFTRAVDFNIQSFIDAEKQQMLLSDYCIAPSTFLANYVKKNYNLCDDVLVFANPYMNKLPSKQEIIDKLEKSIDLEEYKNSFNIVLISRFEGRKQQEKLISAFVNLKKKGLNIRLFLAGNTSYLNNDNKIDYRYFSYCKTNNTEDIYIYDFLNLNEQEKLIAIADLTVLPSIFENQPVAMVETVLRGIPVMAYKYSGIADYTRDERLLFNPFDENDLEQKIEAFYNLSCENREIIQITQYDNLLKFINPKKCIIDRINLPPKNNKTDYRQEMEKLI